MLEENARDFIDLGQAIHDLGAIFGWHKYSAIDPQTHTMRLNTEGETAVRQELQKLLGIAKRLKLVVSGKVVERHLLKSPDSIPQTQNEFDRIVDLFMDEIGARKCLFIPQHLEEYYEWDSIVSEQVITAFPKASEEIRNAGTCFATGAFTACVFHAMRAAEIGLKSLGASLNLTIKSGKPLELAEWREILDSLSTAIHAIENSPNSTPNKEEDLTFYSEVSAQFRFFKNGWRVRAAHARATYTEPQAKEAIDHVRSFFEILAPRLKEIAP